MKAICSPLTFKEEHVINTNPSDAYWSGTDSLILQGPKRQPQPPGLFCSPVPGMQRHNLICMADYQRPHFSLSGLISFWAISGFSEAHMWFYFIDSRSLDFLLATNCLHLHLDYSIALNGSPPCQKLFIHLHWKPYEWNQCQHHQLLLQFPRPQSQGRDKNASRRFTSALGVGVILNSSWDLFLDVLCLTLIHS